MLLALVRQRYLQYPWDFGTALSTYKHCLPISSPFLRGGTYLKQKMYFYQSQNPIVFNQFFKMIVLFKPKTKMLSKGKTHRIQTRKVIIQIKYWINTRIFGKFQNIQITNNVLNKIIF